MYENKHRPITDDERRMILETIPKHYAGTIVLTMLCCGLRPIEIRRMKWDWIDFENAILTVGKSKTEAGTGRKIPIPPVLLDALKEHKAKELNNEYVLGLLGNTIMMLFIIHQVIIKTARRLVLAPLVVKVKQKRHRIQLFFVAEVMHCRLKAVSPLQLTLPKM